MRTAKLLGVKVKYDIDVPRLPLCAQHNELNWYVGHSTVKSLSFDGDVQGSVANMLVDAVIAHEVKRLHPGVKFKF